MKADVPLALDVLSDILANPSFVPDEARAREERDRAGNWRGAQDTPDDVVFEHLNELCIPTSRWAARFWALRRR